MKKKVGFLRDILCALVVLSVLTGCGAGGLLEAYPKDFGLYQQESKENDTKIVALEDILAAPGEAEAKPEEWFLMEETYSYAFDSLSEEEQSWYRDMEQLLGGFGEKTALCEESLAVFADSDVDEIVDRVFRCVLNDHPELFYVDGYSCVKYMRGKKIVSVEFSGTYTMELTDALQYRTAIEESAEDILAGIDREASDYDKVKYVYDTIVSNTDYDLNAPENQNIYSVFVNHRSVCQGYAKAAQYLLNRLGIESTLVLGTVDTGEGHAWNLVKVDGDYYYIDTTWGDVSYQIEESGDSGETEEEGVSQERKENQASLLPEINYDYLNVTTEELLRTHTVGGVVPMPVCTARSANYYIREGAYFTSCDREQLERLFREAESRQQNSVSIKCADDVCYREIFEALVEEQEIFDYMSNAEGSIAYAQNEKQLSLTFWVTIE